MSKGWPGPKRTLEKTGFDQRMGVAAGAVEEEDGVVDVAGRVAMGCAEGDVVEVKLFDGLAVFEVEVGDVVVAVLGGPFGGGGLGVGGCGRGGEEREEDEASDHDEGVSMAA